MKRLVVASLLAFGVATPALAQKTSTKPAPTPATTTYSAKPTHLDIDDDEVVEGGTVGPDGVSVNVRQAKKFPSFLKLRADFLPEMIKSAQDH